jgi:hypothetical protein
MSDQQPFFRDLSGAASSELGIPAHDVGEASRIATAEEMDRIRALGRPRLPKPELPPIKAPILSEDFTERIAQLDEEIYERGLTVDKELLVSLGKERFEQLLAADRKIPRSTLGSNVDVTQFSSVQSALHAFEASSVPRRTTREQVAASGKERDQVRRIASFDDLWKFTSERREVIDDIFACRDLFESLVFAQSMLERLSKDGRLRSRFFCGGKGRRVELLRDWFSVLQGSLVSVTLKQPRWHLMSWLANEKSPSPSLLDLARDFFSVRTASKAQLQIAEAVVDGFLRDLHEWLLWDFVGRRTRQSIDVERLASWRRDLRKRFRAISNFHDEVRATFFKDVGYGLESHREFDGAKHRLFFERTIGRLLATAGGVMAVATKETCNGALIARFEDSLLIEGEPPKQRAALSAELAKVFIGANFQIEFEGAKS